jgi:hypothetical protein
MAFKVQQQQWTTMWWLYKKRKVKGAAGDTEEEVGWGCFKTKKSPKLAQPRTLFFFLIWFRSIVLAFNPLSLFFSFFLSGSCGLHS